MLLHVTISTVLLRCLELQDGDNTWVPGQALTKVQVEQFVLQEEEGGLMQNSVRKNLLAGMFTVKQTPKIPESMRGAFG